MLGVLLFLVAVALHPHTEVTAVSLCQTPVHLGDGQTQPHFFHVEAAGDLDRAAAAFCSRLGLTEADCQRIREHHRTKCFASAREGGGSGGSGGGGSGGGGGGSGGGGGGSGGSGGSGGGGGDGSRGGDGDGDGDTSYERGVGPQCTTRAKGAGMGALGANNACKATADAASSSRSKSRSGAGAVDYSMRVGPVLPVHGLNAALRALQQTGAGTGTGTGDGEGASEKARKKAAMSSFAAHVDVSHDDGIAFILKQRGGSDGEEEDEVSLLQSYLGETPQSSVRRFCGSKRLPEHICGQVREAFLRLYGEDTEADAEAEAEAAGGLGGEEGGGLVAWCWRWASAATAAARRGVTWAEKKLQPHHGVLFLALCVLYVALIQ